MKIAAEANLVEQRERERERSEFEGQSQLRQVGTGDTHTLQIMSTEPRIDGGRRGLFVCISPFFLVFGIVPSRRFFEGGAR
jgi:hypothetical protein